MSYCYFHGILPVTDGRRVQSIRSNGASIWHALYDTMFETESGRQQMLDLLISISEYGYAYIPAVPPILYKEEIGSTSVTPAWRKALWHVCQFPSLWFKLSYCLWNCEVRISHPMVVQCLASRD